MLQCLRYIKLMLPSCGYHEPLKKQATFFKAQAIRSIVIRQFQLGEPHALFQVIVGDQGSFEVSLLGHPQITQQEATDCGVRKRL